MKAKFINLSNLKKNFFIKITIAVTISPGAGTTVRSLLWTSTTDI